MEQPYDSGYVLPSELPSAIRALVAGSGITVEAARNLRTPADVQRAAANLAVWSAAAEADTPQWG